MGVIIEGFLRCCHIVNNSIDDKWGNRKINYFSYKFSFNNVV
jgi:hypothetical protein